jgi:hypothetical protein
MEISIHIMHVTSMGIVRIKKIFKPRQWEPNPITGIRNGRGHLQHIRTEVIHELISIFIYFYISITATTITTTATVNALWHS